MRGKLVEMRETQKLRAREWSRDMRGECLDRVIPSTAQDPTGSPGWIRARTMTVALLLLLLLLVLKLNCCMFLWPSVEQRLFIFQPLTVQLKKASKESMKHEILTKIITCNY